MPADLTAQRKPNTLFTKPQRVVHVVNTLITGFQRANQMVSNSRYQIAHAKNT